MRNGACKSRSLCAQKAPIKYRRHWSTLETEAKLTKLACIFQRTWYNNDTGDSHNLIVVLLETPRLVPNLRGVSSLICYISLIYRAG
jgi:hypothetical protein